MTNTNNSRDSQYSVTSQQRGIALIEAMVALLIVSFGALGLVGMHLFLNGNADVAKQRSEAARLAQGEMESMRVYRTMGTSSDTLFWTNVIKNDAASTAVATGTASSPYMSNTIYALQRSVPASNATAGKYKDVQVSVTWLDRKGESQAIGFRSIINGTDPSTAVSLSVIPNRSPVRETLGRNTKIPFPSKNLGDGTSAFKPTLNGTTAYVIDNPTGIVKKICTTTATTKTAKITTENLTDCTSTELYLLSGFVIFKNEKIVGQFDPVSANDKVPTGSVWNAQMLLNDDAPASNKQGLLSLLADTSTKWSSNPSKNRYALTFTKTSIPNPSCSAEPLQTISFKAAVSYSITNNGTPTTTNITTVYLTIPQSMTAPNETDIAPYTPYSSGQISDIKILNEYFIGYTCIIEPIDLDNDSATTKAWTGISKIVPESGATLGASASDYKICRFSADYNLNGYVWKPITPAPIAANGESVDFIDNEEHPYAYLNVKSALSNQNFLVIKGNESCPSSSAVEVDGTGGEVYTNTTTVLHQHN